MDRKKWLFTLGFFICTVVIADFLVGYFISRDPHLNEVIEFAKSSESLNKRFGNIDKIELSKITHVASTPTQGAYRSYALYAKGSKKSGVFEITVFEGQVGQNKNTMHISR